jgi:probable phosphoglycerate mutase
VSNHIVLPHLIECIYIYCRTEHGIFRLLVSFAPDSSKNIRKLNTKKIYLTRHGQTDFNLKGIVQGSGVDSDLNELGRSQGAAFYDYYKDIAFDKLYVSGLKRTHQSMDGFIQAGLAYEKLSDLNEISWGTSEGVATDAKAQGFYQDMITRWQAGETDIRIEEGESPDEVAVRMRRALDYILVNTEEETVLICMHGRAMRIMLSVMLNYPLRHMDTFEHSNLCLYELTYTGSMFVVDRFNDTTHLTYAGL